MVNSPAVTYSSVMPSVSETRLLPRPAVETGAGARVAVLAATEVGVVVATLSGRLFAGGRSAAVSGADVGTGRFGLLRFVRALYASQPITSRAAAIPRMPGSLA